MDYDDRTLWALKLAKAYPEFDVCIIPRRSGDVVTVRGDEAAHMLTTVGFDDVILIPPQARGKVSKVLIGGCPVGIPPEDLCRDPRVIWLQRRFARGVAQPQVIALVRGDAPPTLEMVCYGDRKVTPYVDDPKLCFKCSRWGHIARNCRNAARCRYCGRFHEARECVAKLKDGQKIPPRCPNCGGKHNAGAWVCPRRPRVTSPPSGSGRAPPPPPPGCGGEACAGQRLGGPGGRPCCCDDGTPQGRRGSSPWGRAPHPPGCPWGRAATGSAAERSGWRAPGRRGRRTAGWDGWASPPTTGGG